MILFAFLFILPDTALKSCNSGKGLPVIEVGLNAPISKITGISWPKDKDSNNFSYAAAFEKPCTLVLTFAPDKRYRTQTQVLLMRQENERVREVNILPFPKVLSFKDALSEMRRICKELGLTNRKELRAQIIEWEKRNPQFALSTRVILDYKVTCYFEIRPKLGLNLKPEGWYIAIDFNYSADNWDQQKALNPMLWRELTDLNKRKGKEKEKRKEKKKEKRTQLETK